MEVLPSARAGASLRMTVRPDMLNGHQICHGGLMTTLADSAFAYACNAYNE
jgi:acyl-CoA thioesterase